MMGVGRGGRGGGKWTRGSFSYCVSFDFGFWRFFFFDRLGWISTGYRAWDFRSGSDVRFGRFF